jgi:predicted TIM-barrel fold metal-dependent hydrolase
LIVDAYAHCGRNKYLPAEQLIAVMNDVGIDRTILCQHLEEYDNGYLRDVVKEHSDKFRAVCLIDPTRRDALDQLKEWQATGAFRGVRVVAGWLSQYPGLWLAAMKSGLNLVVYAPNGIKSAAQDIITAARGCPSACVVVSHLGNPRVVDGQVVDGMELLTLAQTPNVYVQLSGQSMFCNYPYAALDSFTTDVVKSFGPSRILWGSNLPVSGDSHAVRRDLALLRPGAWGLDQEGIEWVTSRTAMRVWFASAA